VQIKLWVIWTQGAEFLLRVTECGHFRTSLSAWSLAFGLLWTAHSQFETRHRQGKEMNMRFIRMGLCVLVAAATLIPVKALASPQSVQDLRNFLEAYKKDPDKAMLIKPVVRDLEGNLEEHNTPLTENDYKAIADAHLKMREHLCTIVDGQRVCVKDIMQGKAGIKSNERPEDLVEGGPVYHTLGEMEHAGLLKYTVPGRLPWSSSYWPILSGVVAARYTDGGFLAADGWAGKHAYVMSNPASASFAGGSGDNMSPAEKYDYIVGDSGYTLTQRMWGRGASGKVGGWEGICDGWSAASIVFDEPIKGFYATAASGKQVHFYPDDVKALSSILWSAATPNVRFYGNRCEVGSPVRDPVGRIKPLDPHGDFTDPDRCWDVNPGIFHMVAVNQIGNAHRPFILDGVYDQEIWNYPTWRYEYTYFNPQTLQPVDHWKDAVVAKDRFYIDRFKPYRGANTKYVAGIAMNVTYMVEMNPSHVEGQHIQSAKTVQFVYDLELDADMKIIGGEWYSWGHPDFVWSPPKGARAMSVGDSHLLGEPAWNGMDLVPSSYVEVAPTASGSDQPLAVVVEQLVRISH
jgi:hypothetical protein